MLDGCFMSSKNKILVLVAVHGHSYGAKLDSGGCKHAVFRVRVKCTDALWVVAGVHSVEEAQICKIINVNSGVKNDCDSTKVIRGGAYASNLTLTARITVL